jgi:hypothetical protein
MLITYIMKTVEILYIMPVIIRSQRIFIVKHVVKIYMSIQVLLQAIQNICPKNILILLMIMNI